MKCIDRINTEYTRRITKLQSNKPQKAFLRKVVVFDFYLANQLFAMMPIQNQSLTFYLYIYFSFLRGN